MKKGDLVCETWRDADTNREGHPVPKTVFRVVSVSSTGIIGLERPPASHVYVSRIEDLRPATDDEAATVT